MEDGSSRTSSPAGWSALTVPLVLLLGFASGRSVPAGRDSDWYMALTRPAQTPPDWAFPIAWTTIYILLGIAIAIVLAARPAPGRGRATTLFMLGFAPSLAWTPIFFGAHLVSAAMWLIAAMVAVGIATAFAFGRVRRAAAWLMVPYLVWISFAGILTWSIDRLNPDAETLVPPPARSQMA